MSLATTPLGSTAAITSRRAATEDHEDLTEAVGAVAPARGPAEPNHLLAPYFRGLAALDVMNKDEELASAARIAELRRSFWRSVLSYPPFIDGICDLARAVLPTETCPVEELDALKRTSRALRDRDLLAHQTAFEAAREALAERMGLCDVDALVSDRVFADLASVELGQNEGLSMKVKLPRKDSVPFLRYVAAVRAHHHALAAAKNAFVKANLRLVVAIARRFNHGQVPMQDLIQEGNLGLMKAVDRFDHRKGFRFSTYGSWWIRHAISRSISDKSRAVRLPVHMNDARNKLTRAGREFEALHGRRPTEDELATLTGVSSERIRRMRWALVEAPLSLDHPISDGSGLTMADVIEDPGNEEPSERMDSALLTSQLREVFDQLSPIEADILRKRTGLDDEDTLTLKEIGEHYSLSRERIRQLQEQALAKIRGEFHKRNLM